MKLIFKGIVQGVGFRPTIFRIAKKLGLNGYVLNKGSEVEVIIDKDVVKFIKLVKKQLPSIAKITDIEIKKDDRKFNDFIIHHSQNAERHSPIPVDVATCDECIKELLTPSDRRYHFPFTNCTVCGARFAIIKDLPYDRERTSMDEFKLCKECQKEYTDSSNRRFHAQTISCPICGPVYKLYDTKKKIINVENVIQTFAEKIDRGSIGVIKSWGGMHLCCKLTEIEHFRKWYGRPQKSFAVMVKDIKTAKTYGEISEYEQELLLSKSRPIVLVNKKKAELASPGLNTLGLFLPYTGLHHLLFSYLKSDAFVMTSANIPGEPMLTKNQEVFSLNADYYILHNREIPNRVDDTVLRTWNKKIFFLRKSRGFVPDPIDVPYNHRILSVGAGENISSAISYENKIYNTQYIGNSKYYTTLEFLEQALRNMMNLIMKTKKIDAVTMDMHPGYDSRKVAKRFSEEFSAPLYEVQHHWAHAASLLLDNNIEQCVVLTLDGLGYGDDGTFWGGEVLSSDYHSFERVGHLEYIPLLGGDQATMDPRRLVFAIFKKYNKEMFFTSEQALILSKIMDKAPQSSSLGRILDAISCYLGICCKRTYDGEPAMKLEKYLAVGKEKYSLESNVKNNVVSTIDLFRQIDEKVKPPFSEKEKADIAYSMVKCIVDRLTDIAINHANENNIKNIGLSGGVTYNIPITEMVEKQVKKAGLHLLVHNKIPNGDGCVGIGQNVIIGHKLLDS